MIAVLVLAAGASRRLGTPKQLVEIEGVSLLARAVDAALPVGLVLVILGAHRARIEPTLGARAVTVLENPAWEEGMGSSLRVGLAAAPTATRLLVMLCDQPAITTAHLAALARAPRPIAASAYDGVLGVPAAFSREVFPELASIRGDRGAREVIRRDPRRVQAIPFEGWDIDRAEDLRG